MDNIVPIANLLLAPIVLFGALSQRVTGMGFGLIATPFMALLMGPDLGVSLVLILALASSVLTWFTVRRDVDWYVLPRLLVPALVGVVPGIWVWRLLPKPALQMSVGALVLLGIGVAVYRRSSKVLSGKHGATYAGFISGFMNSTAALGGPPLVVYQISTAWRHREFVATLQIYFVVVTSLAVLLRGSIHSFGFSTWAISASMLALGLWLGSRVSSRIKERVARTLTVTVAGLGGMIVFGQGILGLVG